MREERKKFYSSFTPPTRAASTLTPPTTKQPGRVSSDPSWPQGGAQLCTLSIFSFLLHFPCQGPPWEWGGSGCWEREGVEPWQCLRESFPPHTCEPFSLLLLTAALDLQLSPKPVFAELALNKDLETRVSKIQTLASFKKLSEELHPFCETTLANTAKGNMSHSGYRHSTSPRPQIKWKPLTSICQALWHLALAALLPHCHSTQLSL